MQDLILISISVHELKTIIEQSVKKAVQEIAPSTIQGKEKSSLYLNVQQASQFTHMAIATLYDYTHKKKIPFSKIGKRLLFSKKELTEWIQKHRKKTRYEIDQEADDWLNKNK
ncbi:MAG: helix-turn-helix domain-containing protein [Flavobacteriales bacterium]|nr:helix-turn-helix domain-containing protein [Flavobacteriales bacterium]